MTKKEKRKEKNNSSTSSNNNNNFSIFLYGAWMMMIWNVCVAADQYQQQKQYTIEGSLINDKQQ